MLTVVGTLLYLLTYIGFGKRYHKVWYVVALVGIVELFLILIYQNITKRGLQPSQLLKDDNVHYFFIALVLLWVRPNVLLPLLPFFIYLVFHVLVYVNNYLLPLENPAITLFIAHNNVNLVRLGTQIEIFSWFWLLLRVVAWRRKSIIPFIAYTLFLRFRYEKMALTRTQVKNIEIKIDQLVNNANIPAVKNVWIQVKQVIRNAGGVYLVNDYTKEKTT